jgi:hypothetical protein
VSSLSIGKDLIHRRDLAAAFHGIFLVDTERFDPHDRLPFVGGGRRARNVQEDAGGHAL